MGGGAGLAEAPQDFKLMLLQNDVQNVEMQERKHKPYIEVSNCKYMNSALVTCNKLDPIL